MRSLTATILFLFVWLAGCDFQRYSTEEKFEEIQKKLMASMNDLTRVPPQVELAGEPYIKGKIAVFQALEMKGAKDKTYFMQPFYFREMQDAYAAAPEEVGTVALVDCQTLTKGVYTTTDGREFPAEVEDCGLTMIDRSKPAVVFKRKFEKTPSQEQRTYGNSMVKQTAQMDILQFLKGLPRR